jgi:hypothetical protein
MGRILLSCALVLSIIGCGSGGSETNSAPASTSEPGAVINQPSGIPAQEEIADGPSEADLPKTLDMPLYPGSRLVSSKVATAGEEKRYRILLETPDSAKKVGEFYTKSGLPMEVRGGKAQFMGLTKKGNNVLMFAEEKDGKTTITIRVSPATH